MSKTPLLQNKLKVSFLKRKSLNTNEWTDSRTQGLLCQYVHRGTTLLRLLLACRLSLHFGVSTVKKKFLELPVKDRIGTMQMLWVASMLLRVAPSSVGPSNTP